MGPVKLVTDSSANAPPLTLCHENCQVLPIKFRIGNRLLEDTPDAAEFLYMSIASGGPLASSAPALLDYLGCLAAGDDLLFVTPAREFSAMHRAASMAAEIAGRPVEVVDSRTAGVATLLVADATLSLLDAGADVTEAADGAREVAGRTEMAAALPGALPPGGDSPGPYRSLVRLRGGAAIASPDDDGEVIADPISRLRTEWLEDGGWNADRTAVFHSGAPGLAAELAERLGCDAPVGRLSPALGQLAGLGSVGIAWTRRG